MVPDDGAANPSSASSRQKGWHAGTGYVVAEMGAAPEISVVIPTFNRSRGCEMLLRGLAAQSLAPERFEVVVVDDCSSDDTVGALRRLVGEMPYRLQVLQTRANRGPAQARNVGWRAAIAPVVAFMDDDCLPEADWLAAGLAFMSAHPTVGVAQGRTRAPDGVDVSRLQGWYVWRVIDGPTPYFDACNIFFRRPALDATGGFDEEIAWWSDPAAPGAVPVAWGEDSAAGWAVVEAGWDRDFVPDAVVVHEVELRGWWWHVKRGYLDRIIVGLAVEHPGYRREAFWKPWAYRREDAAFLAAVTGMVVATKWRPAAIAAVPYLWWRRPSIRKPRFLRMCVQNVVVDAARAAGQLSGAVKYRTFVL
jgi:glycosyltransferase involved in cell wall biosynthesis